MARLHNVSTYIIEHPTRGTLKFFHSVEEFGFSTAGRRDDPDRTMQFYSFDEAKKVFNRLPQRLHQGGLTIRSFRRGYDVVHPLTPELRKQILDRYYYRYEQNYLGDPDYFRDRTEWEKDYGDRALNLFVKGSLR